MRYLCLDMLAREWRTMTARQMEGAGIARDEVARATDAARQGRATVARPVQYWRPGLKVAVRVR